MEDAMCGCPTLRKEKPCSHNYRALHDHSRGSRPKQPYPLRFLGLRSPTADLAGDVSERMRLLCFSPLSSKRVL